jgi:hypothetical protein
MVVSKQRKIDLRKRMQNEIIAAEGYHSCWKARFDLCEIARRHASSYKIKAFDGQHYSDNTRSH